jgi:hypothetical protein
MQAHALLSQLFASAPVGSVPFKVDLIIEEPTMYHLPALRSNVRLAAYAGALTWAILFGVPPHVAPAQAENTRPVSAAAAVCPAGYDLIMSAYCMSSTGDVVEPEALHRATATTICPRDYVRMDDLCFSTSTGDIVAAETTSKGPAAN